MHYLFSVKKKMKKNKKIFLTTTAESKTLHML